MASTGSSDGETEEDNTDQTFSPKKVGRAAEYPEFAIIWSYLENFCELLRFPELSLDGLEDAFNSHSPRNENCRQLEYLHKKLLIKLHKNFRANKWEKALLKVAKEQNMLSSWDLENFGYDQLKICTKLELFKLLLESQFDHNNKLKTTINKNYEAEELRLQPFGHDMDGLLYWFHMQRYFSKGDLDELGVVVDYLSLKSETNPKDIVLAKREEERNKQQENTKTTNKKGKKSKKAAAKEELDDDDNPCAKCYSNVHPDSIVLLERLKEKRTRLVAREKLRARQAKRLSKSGMNLSNILQGPGSDEEQIETIRRSGRARKTVDYTFRDFDEEIMDAVETDAKRPKLDPEMNGHPTGKPAFAVERFYSPSESAPAIGRRRSRRLKDLDSGSDSDSKLSEYEYDGSTDDDRPKRPERHVYLRRHIIEDDDEDEDEDEGKTNGKCETDEENSEGEKLKVEGSKEDEGDDDDKETVKKNEEEDTNDESLNDSQESNKDNTDEASSEKSGPTAPVASTNDKDTPKTKEGLGDDEGAVHTEKEHKKESLDIPKSKPPPLERISSPKIDPLLDALGFGALASCFSSSERYPTRPEPYGTLRSPSASHDIRSPLRPDAGFSTERLGVPPSPSSYPRVGTDSRYGTYPNYDQSSSYGNYFGYNQTDYSSVPGIDTYPSSTQSSRQSFAGLNMPGTRQFPGYNALGISKRDTSAFNQTPQSPSYNQPPSYGSSMSGYPTPYPGTDMTSRSGYYPSTNQGYGFPNKTPYGQPPQGYFPDDPFSSVDDKHGSTKITPGCAINVPKFYFPYGKPPCNSSETDATLKTLVKVFDVFDEGRVTKEHFSAVTKACNLPLYWKEPLFSATGGHKNGYVTLSMFSILWRRLTSTCFDDVSKFVYLMSSKPSKNILESEDFVPLIQDIVNTHVGLAFLQDAPEFHSRYVHTVIARIFYNVNSSWTGKITIPELRRSNFLEVLSTLEDEEDINEIVDYFSYEHFYVIYCKFWELDTDHDLLIDEKDLAKHNNHALSSRIVKRLFSGSVTRGKTSREGKMTYPEFVWFLLSEEDKKHPRSIEFWFRCMDTNGDGVLSMYELEFFYEEQATKMEVLGIEAMSFQDCLCQVLDMVKPVSEEKITLSDLRRCKMAHIFYNTFFNLDKYIEFEQRDPFATAKESSDVESTQPSDWERYAQEEYELLVAEEGANDQGDGYEDDFDADDEDLLDEDILSLKGLSSEQEASPWSIVSGLTVDDDDNDDT
ncbi:hypothetical protein QZH41_000982 [Actinostola sp. cb2023]|nr:hypothetical protein QZH41_000982 [Actinostola sp. cb2023]